MAKDKAITIVRLYCTGERMNWKPGIYRVEKDGKWYWLYDERDNAHFASMDETKVYGTMRNYFTRIEKIED